MNNFVIHYMGNTFTLPDLELKNDDAHTDILNLYSFYQKGLRLLGYTKIINFCLMS